MKTQGKAKKGKGKKGKKGKGKEAAEPESGAEPMPEVSKNDEFCMKTRNFVSKMMNFAGGVDRGGEEGRVYVREARGLG